MAMFVVLKSKNSEGKPNNASVHTPFINLPKFDGEEIDFIQADCDELDEIATKFTQGGIARVSDSEETICPPTYSIPMPNGKRVVRWYGDIAKTIYFNL